MPPHYRIFISSPSDVFAERERVERVISRLDGEFGGGLLEAIRWERSYYTATATFQHQIPLPSETDLVICILWKRLGFELPPDYRRADGTTPTGTEYEFEDAMQAARAKGTPDVLVYRKVAPVLLNAEQIEMERAQFEALKQFWMRWFQNESGHFTAAYQTFVTTDQFETEVEDHIRQWLARHKLASAGVVWPVELKGSPFRGLQPFDAGHAEVFFGRRRVIERARERLADAARRGAPFLLLLGMSGSGKSSLARAGLVPRLTQSGVVSGVDLWRRAVMRPSEGETPLHALARALYRPEAIPELAEGDNPSPADLAALFASAPEAAARAIRRALHRSTASLAAREGFDRPVVAQLLLVVDQFEEALGSPDARDAFARALQALAASGAVWIVATLRSDLYALFQASAPLMALREKGAQIDLLPPGAAELREIVTGPAAAAGLRFDTRPDGTTLDEELTAAANQKSALPLLQLTLDALFEARDRTTNLLTVAAYDALGGLSGVVERRAEAALTALDAEAAAALPEVLRALVDVSGEGAVTARAALASEVARSGAAKRLADAFIAARLLVSGTHGEETSISVAHEALLSSWPRAAALITADRDMLRTRGRVAAAARRWLQENRDSDFLLPPGRPLAEASELALHRGDVLDEDARAFIAASQAAETRRQGEVQAHAQRELKLEAEAQQARADAATRVVRRTRAAAGVVFALLLAALGAAAYAESQRQEAERQTAEAERNFKAALDGGASLVTAVDAHLRDGGMTVAVARALLDTAKDTLGGLVGTRAAATAPPALLDTQTRLQSSFASVQLALCDSAGARARAQDAVAIAERVLDSAPDDARRLGLVVALDALGQAARGDGDPAAALTAYRRAETLAMPLADAGATGFADALRNVRRDMANALLDRGEQQTALALLRDDLAWQQREAQAKPEDRSILSLEAIDLRGIAFAALAQGDSSAAEAALSQEAEILTRLSQAEPANLEWQRAQSINARQQSRILEGKGDAAGALAKAREAADLAGAILVHDRDNAGWQRDLVFANVRLGTLLARTGDLAATLRVLRPTVARVKSLTSPQASSLLCKGDAERLHAMAGNALMLTGDSVGAAQELGLSLAVAKDAALSAPDDLERLHDLMEAEMALATAFSLDGRGPLAAEHDRAAIASAEKLIAARPDEPELQRELADLRLSLGDALRQTNDLAGALQAYTEGRNEAEKLAAAQPMAAQWQHQAVVAGLRVATVHLLAQKPDEQWAALQTAAAAVEKLVALEPDTAEWQGDLLEVRQAYAGAETARGEFAAALAHYLEALAIADVLVARNPSDSRWRRAQAIALTYAGLGYKFSGQLEMAQSYFDKGQAALEALRTGRPPETAAPAPATTPSPATP